MKNLEEALVDPKRIDYIVCSHKHWDHIGGLDTLLHHTDRPLVFVPTTFSSSLKSEITKFAELREVTKNKGEEIMPMIYTSPLMKTNLDSLNEISLFIKTESGIVAICGCSHQGLDKIIAEGSKLGKIHAVIGGFHGFDKLKSLKDVNMIVPCHCTKKKEEIMLMYPDKTKRCFAGLKLTIK
jgi:7,8-dihydropterin-6-yl-methyl-4-(beta-D-ribofuranosyl)aminobenzene 5'-phosphate synthase